MSEGQFLHCRDCDAVFRPSRHDRAPEYRMTADGYTEVMRDDCADFLVRHARHALITLRPSGGVPLHDAPLWDPMGRTYWPVTDGSETFVIEGARDRLDSALRYRVRPGQVVTEQVSIEIPEDHVREQIDRALYPGVAPERKLAAFMERFRTIVFALDPASLEVLYDLPSDPSLSVAQLPEKARERLGREARKIFDEGDAARVVATLVPTDEQPDAMSVLVRRHIRVE
jgi:hypothetical protein